MCILLVVSTRWLNYTQVLCLRNEGVKGMILKPEGRIASSDQSSGSNSSNHSASVSVEGKLVVNECVSCEHLFTKRI